MDKEVLLGLGLTNNEVEAYLSLLRLGSSTANDIAKQSGLHRQAIYDALERLLEKGFAGFVIKNNVKYFQAMHPSKIIDFLEDKKRSVELLLPELSKITKEGSETTRVESYKGRGALRVYFREAIKEFKGKKEPPLVYGVEEKRFHEADKIAIEIYLRELRKLGIKERVLVKEGEKYFVLGEQTIYREIPGRFFSSLPMCVCGNKLFIQIWGDPIYVIIIENSQLAEAYKRQFMALWKIAKQVKNERLAIANQLI